MQIDSMTKTCNYLESILVCKYWIKYLHAMSTHMKSLEV
jgi:hypothetical protein